MPKRKSGDDKGGKPLGKQQKVEAAQKIHQPDYVKKITEWNLGLISNHIQIGSINLF